MDVLDQQHRRIAALFEQVSSPDADRPAVLHTLLRELAAHVTAERSEVYPEVKSRGIGGDGMAGELHSDYEHIERLMARIERRKFNSPDLPTLVTELKDASDAHLARCRAKLVPGLQESLSKEEQELLGDRVTNADSLVVSHPHPHLLSLGPVSSKLTSLVARFDHWRDKTVTSQPPPSGGSSRGP